jgi:hypothetical protein
VNPKLLPWLALSVGIWTFSTPALLRLSFAILRAALGAAFAGKLVGARLFEEVGKK